MELLIVLAVLYFLPVMIGLARRHHNLMPIVIVNVFLGWTLVGWVVALAWSFSSKPANVNPPAAPQ